MFLPMLVGAVAALLAIVGVLFWVTEVGEAPGNVPASASGSESALIQARDWLLSAQGPDGSWEPERWGGAVEYRIALTGLATLALSGDHRPPAAEAMTRAGRFLVKSQASDGHLGERTRSSLYNHAIGTLALIELADSDGAREVAGRAVQYLVETQTAEGAWGYLSGEGTVENDSISVWALEALVRARATGFVVEFDAVERGFDWFEGLVRHKERRTYLGYGGHVCGEASSPLVAFAVLSRGLRADTRSFHVALDRCMRQADGASLCFYDSYFIARSSLVVHSPILEEFRVRAQRVLEGSQVRTGQLSGSWEPGDRWSPVGGRLYTTALAALALKPADA